MIALDAHTGDMLWEWTGRPGRICNVTAASDGRIVFASVFGNAYEWPFGVRLFGLDLETGRELWGIPNVGGLTAPIVTRDGFLFSGSMGSPFLYDFQLGDAPEAAPRDVWRARTGGLMYESLPAVSGNMGFFLSNDGWLRAIY